MRFAPWSTLLLAVCLAPACVTDPDDKSSKDDTDTDATSDTETGDSDSGDTQDTAQDPAVAQVPVDQLQITEIMADPTACGDEGGEYLEIHYTGTVDIDAAGLTVSDGGGTYVFPAPFPVSPGTRIQRRFCINGVCMNSELRANQ